MQPSNSVPASPCVSACAARHSRMCTSTHPAHGPRATAAPMRTGCQQRFPRAAPSGGSLRARPQPRRLLPPPPRVKPPSRPRRRRGAAGGVAAALGRGEEARAQAAATSAGLQQVRASGTRDGVRSAGPLGTLPRRTPERAAAPGRRRTSGARPARRGAWEDCVVLRRCLVRTSRRAGRRALHPRTELRARAAANCVAHMGAVCDACHARSRF